MGILAIGEYIKHWKRNVFVVIQISVLLLVLCVSEIGRASCRERV